MRPDVDLGDGVTGTFVSMHGDPEKKRIGIVVVHRRPDNGEECWASCHWGYPGKSEQHELVSMDPLTVAPSLDCPECGLHGYIRDGKWVPA